MIRPAQSRDGAALADLYNHYAVNTVTTFEAEPVSADVMAERAATVQQGNLPWIVLEAEVGYKFGHWVDVGYWQRLLR